MIHLRRNSRIPGRTVSTKRGRKGVYRVYRHRTLFDRVYSRPINADVPNVRVTSFLLAYVNPDLAYVRRQRGPRTARTRTRCTVAR